MKNIIKPSRGARRRARRLAVNNPLTHVIVMSKAGDTMYDAWVNEARRLTAWIFYCPSSPRDGRWLRRCPTVTPRGGRA